MKLDLSEIKKSESKDVKRLNSIEAIRKYNVLDEAKIKIIESPRKHKILIGAKDSGKTKIVKVDTIRRMEQDPMASSLAARKYSTAAAKRLGNAFFKELNRMKKMGFKFPLDYKKSQNFTYRLADKMQMVNNQSEEYLSFDDENGISGIDLANGGYFTIVHVEEPALKDDPGKTPKEEEWNSTMKVIEDSVDRTVRDYASTNPFYQPIPCTYYYTLNDWDEDFALSIYAERHFPRNNFLKANLGGLDPELLLGNRELVLNNWERIRKALVENHTMTVVVEADDTDIVRMTKLANPQLREDEKLLEKTMMAMQKALITGDSFEMARQLGMLYEGGDVERAYNDEFIANATINTHDRLKDKVILGRSIGWDIDVNRRLTGTVTLVAAKLENQYLGMDRWRGVLSETELITLPQIIIPTYGKGDAGRNIAKYQQQIANMTASIIKQYPIVHHKFGNAIVMDDNFGPWLSNMAQHLPNLVDNKKQLQGLWLTEQVKTGKENNILRRQAEEQMIIDEEVIKIDHSNKELIKFFKEVPRDDKKQRIEKGKFEEMADVVNSLEASLYPLRGLFPLLIDEKRKELDLLLNTETQQLGNDEFTV